MPLHNFSAGPSILPKQVFEKAAQGVLDLDGSGLSILEISHRSSEFKAIHERCISLVKELLGIKDEFKVLLLTGGASSQFYMVPMNILTEGGKAAYLDTGTWSAKAIKEVRKFGEAQVVASSKDDGYTSVPKEFVDPSDASYLHITSNNTIFGTEIHDFPTVTPPLVADMSSDIMAKPIDLAPFGVIYAGAQKNLGPAGVTLVLVREELLGKTGRDIPSMLDYRTHIEKDSMFNTPPVFPIYAMMLNLEWLKENGGVQAAYERNQAKAKLIYDEIDSNPMFKGVAAKDDRSMMNVTFTLEDSSKEAEFVDQCAKAGCVGVKGHRSVGGFRASIYNAMPLSGVEALVEQMQLFSQE